MPDLNFCWFLIHKKYNLTPIIRMLVKYSTYYVNQEIKTKYFFLYLAFIALTSLPTAISGI